MTSSADSITTLLFDLDDTLYHPSSGVWQAIGERINRFMAERVGIPAERVAALREQYFVTFGTTLNGLRANHGVDPEEYLAFVHDIPLDRLLAEDLQLQGMLALLPQRKVIFSNADRAHAQRVLQRHPLTGFHQQTRTRSLPAGADSARNGRRAGMRNHRRPTP